MDDMCYEMTALFAVAFAGTWWIYKYILRIAVAKGIVDSPSGRKLQKRSVPVLGGVAVAFGLTAAGVTGGMFGDASSFYSPLCVAMLMLYVGVTDDILYLSPRLRLMVEALAVLALLYSTGFGIDSFHGLWGIGRLPQWSVVCLTVFAGIGIINAVNLLDGVNGLSSGYSIFACCAFCAYSYPSGGGMYLGAASSGALIPFLCHNVFGSKSRMFIGDGGTMLMGTILFFLVADNLHGATGSVSFCLSVLSVPIFDTVRVMCARVRNGRSPFCADRGHLHHLLIDTHFSHVGTACTEILLGLLVVGSWWLARMWGASVDVQFYMVLCVGVSLTWGLYGCLSYARSRESGFHRRVCRLGERTHVGYSRWFLWLRERMDRDCP